MKKIVTKVSDEEMLRLYDRPLRHEGWFARVDEAANGCWVAEASDAWGRKINRSGSDPDELLKLLEEEVDSFS